VIELPGYGGFFIVESIKRGCSLDVGEISYIKVSENNDQFTRFSEDA